MTEQKDEFLKGSLGEKLERMIKDLPPDEMTLADVRGLVGRDGLLVLTIFLAIVFLIPVSIPGVSTVFGAAILLVGICRLLKRDIWLPERILLKRFPADKLKAGLYKGTVFFKKLERFSKPHRLNLLAGGGSADTVNNLALIAGACLLMAPFGFIPFSNTLPALAVLFLAVGILQRDGICVLLGHLSNLATVIYFTMLVAGGGVTIYEIFRRIFVNS